MRKLLFSCLFALSSVSALANPAPAPTLALTTNPVLEKHVMAISEELRCLVCQNQTIADSHAELAIDLRNQVREQLVQGRSDKQVVDYMVERYGDFVLYRPPLKSTTLLLWFGPFLFLIGGGGFLGLKLARGRRPVDDVAPADMAHAAELLRAGTDLKDAK